MDNKVGANAELVVCTRDGITTRTVVDPGTDGRPLAADEHGTHWSTRLLAALAPGGGEPGDPAGLLEPRRAVSEWTTYTTTSAQAAMSARRRPGVRLGVGDSVGLSPTPPPPSTRPGSAGEP